MWKINVTTIWTQMINFCLTRTINVGPPTAEMRLQFPWASRTTSTATCLHKETPTSFSTSSRTLCPLIWPLHRSRSRTALYSQRQLPPKSLYLPLRKSPAYLLLHPRRPSGSRGRITRNPLNCGYPSRPRTCWDLYPRSLQELHHFRRWHHWTPSFLTVRTCLLPIRNMSQILLQPLQRRRHRTVGRMTILSSRLMHQKVRIENSPWRHIVFISFLFLLSQC